MKARLYLIAALFIPKASAYLTGLGLKNHIEGKAYKGE
jgi:hypothetical protein